MASEAQKLIGISLTKIAQSRTHRGGASLHKNLLVATVLQRARCIFMEETYSLVSYSRSAAVDKAGSEEIDFNGQEYLLHREESPCVECSNNQQNKKTHSSKKSIYNDQPKNNQRRSSSCSSPVKRRHCVSEKETEDAVQSILPKKRRHKKQAMLTLDSNVKDKANEAELNVISDSSMEIDRITSLVSIFNFGIGGDSTTSKLNRPLPSSDLCSSQAKESTESIQPRPFLTMIV